MRERERKQAEERLGVCDDTGVGGQRSSCICARTLGTSDDFGKKTKQKNKLSVCVSVGVCVCAPLMHSFMTDPIQRNMGHHAA